MPEPTLVSVVIPTRNRRHLVSRAIASARAQTYPNIEIVVVDDGSTDGTAGDLAQFGDVRLVRLEQPAGGAAARNHGIAASAGAYVAFLDSDDEWLPEKLERQAAVLAGSPLLGAVYCRHISHDDVTGVRSVSHGALYTGDITEELFSGRCPRTVSLFLVRRDALEEVGGFDESLRGFQDTDLWMRLSSKWRFGAVDEPLAVVHNHADSRITTDIDARLAALDGFLAKWGAEMETRMGRDGVEEYRRKQLAVARGAAVLDLVRHGYRRQALHELRRYVSEAGVSNPTQLMGLIIAVVGGISPHTRLKRLRHRASR
jgi:glycosyltransferase involved in cell wall biosynthesis